MLIKILLAALNEAGVKFQFFGSEDNEMFGIAEFDKAEANEPLLFWAEDKEPLTLSP